MAQAAKRLKVIARKWAQWTGEREKSPSLA